MDTASQDLAAEIDQCGLDAAAIEAHADAEDALGLRLIRGGWLATAFRAASTEANQVALFERLDDAADGRVGELGPAGQIGP